MGIVDVTNFENDGIEYSWGLTARYFFIGIGIFGLTFLLHKAVNWIFQKERK